MSDNDSRLKENLHPVGISRALISQQRWIERHTPSLGYAREGAIAI